MNRRFSLLTGTLLVAALSFMGLPCPSQQSLICRKHAINGLEAVHDRAERIISAQTTNDPRKMRVYLSVEGHELYAQSNFLNEGMEYPTKILTPQEIKKTDLLAINLVGADDSASQKQVVDALPNVTWYVDKAVFSDEKYGSLDFQGGHVLVVGADDIPRESKLVYTGFFGKRFLRVSDHVFAPLSEDVGRLVDAMNSAPFNSDRVGLLPLVSNRATLEAMASLPKASRATLGELTREGLFRTIDDWSGKTLFVLGHVEDAAFVMRDATGDLVLKMPLQEVITYGRGHKVNIMAVGCNSAVYTGTGAANVFNTVDAVSHFSAALSSRNWVEFLSTFAGRDLDLVVNHSIVDAAGRLHVGMAVHRSTRPSFFPVGSLNGTLLPNEPTGYPWYVWVVGILFVLFIVGRLAEKYS